jgi:hypothetical protein
MAPFLWRLMINLSRSVAKVGVYTDVVYLQVTQFDHITPQTVEHSFYHIYTSQYLFIFTFFGLYKRVTLLQDIIFTLCVFCVKEMHWKSRIFKFL